MSIELKYILIRNKINLDNFIIKNKLTSYEDLVSYCYRRNFIPCSEDEFNNVVKKDEQKPDTKTKKTKSPRPTSNTQKPKKRRYRRKKQQDTSKLPDSSDKG